MINDQLKGSLSDWNRLSIAKHDKRIAPTTTWTYFQFPHFLQSRWTPQQVEPCAPAWRNSEGRELFDESVTVGSERRQGELRRLICKNRIMLVHRIKRWAPCFLSAVTEGLHQEVAGVRQATVSTLFSPSSLSSVAAYADRTERSDPLLCLMQSCSLALSSRMPLKLVWPHREKRVRKCSKWDWNVADLSSEPTCFKCENRCFYRYVWAIELNRNCSWRSLTRPKPSVMFHITGYINKYLYTHIFRGYIL